MSTVKKSAIIFDVDGVLLDTVPYHFTAWQKMFTDEGVAFTMDDYLKKVNGLPRLTGIKNVLTEVNEEKISSLAQKKQDYYLELVSVNPPVPLPGVIEFLSVLRDKNYRLAAASSSKNAPTLIKNANLESFFEVIIGGNDFKNSKPDPEIFVTAANRLGVKPQECIVVEDAVLGVLAAKTAGMGTVGLLSSDDTEIKTQADTAIQSMKDFMEAYLFFKLN